MLRGAQPSSRLGFSLRLGFFLPSACSRSAFFARRCSRLFFSEARTSTTASGKSSSQVLPVTIASVQGHGFRIEAALPTVAFFEFHDPIFLSAGCPTPGQPMSLLIRLVLLISRICRSVPEGWRDRHRCTCGSGHHRSHRWIFRSERRVSPGNSLPPTEHLPRGRALRTLPER